MPPDHRKRITIEITTPFNGTQLARKIQDALNLLGHITEIDISIPQYKIAFNKRPDEVTGEKTCGNCTTWERYTKSLLGKCQNPEHDAIETKSTCICGNWRPDK